jgi:hypothetical protein
VCFFCSFSVVFEFIFFASPTNQRFPLKSIHKDKHYAAFGIHTSPGQDQTQVHQDRAWQRFVPMR